MGTLLLVRHGRASGYGSERVDLTATGLEQSRRLGRYWAGSGLRLDRVYVGPRARHAQTAAAVVAAFREAGQAFPEPAVAPQLDEYPAVEVFQRALGGEPDEQLRSWMAAWQDGGPEARPSFERAFAHIMRRYASGSLAFEDVATFATFRVAVDSWLRGLDEESGRGATLAAFTSAGAVAAAVGRALEIGDEKVMELAFVVANTAVTEFRFTRGRLSLVAFNVCPHQSPAAAPSPTDTGPTAPSPTAA